eukprot:scaffold530_cov193-Alexandrium_tamarense.AAC.42
MKVYLSSEEWSTDGEGGGGCQWLLTLIAEGRKWKNNKAKTRNTDDHSITVIPHSTQTTRLQYLQRKGGGRQVKQGGSTPKSATSVPRHHTA